MEFFILISALFAFALADSAQADIKIAHVYGKTGPYQVYARQSQRGLMLGLEYATHGTMKVNGQKLVVIEKDTQLKPDLGKAALAEAYGDDNADIAVGPVSSAVALAMLPVARQYRKILIVEPAVADSITGKYWNRHIFRTARNSSQDAISNAVAIGGKGVNVATLAQDYAFGHDGISAFATALKKTGAKVVDEEFVPTKTTDFTAAAQRIFARMKGIKGPKKLFVLWAGGGNPMGKIKAMAPSRYGIELATGGNILAALKGYKKFPGMEGATYYYYGIPKNPVNDWLVKEHFKRFHTPPDFFTAGGMASGMAIVKAIRTAGSTNTEALIKAMEGMHWL